MPRWGRAVGSTWTTVAPAVERWPGRVGTPLLSPCQPGLAAGSTAPAPWFLPPARTVPNVNFCFPAVLPALPQEAGMLAVRKNRYVILPKDFEKAYKNVVRKQARGLSLCSGRAGQGWGLGWERSWAGVRVCGKAQPRGYGAHGGRKAHAPSACMWSHGLHCLLVPVSGCSLIASSSTSEAGLGWAAHGAASSTRRGRQSSCRSRGAGGIRPLCTCTPAALAPGPRCMPAPFVSRGLPPGCGQWAPGAHRGGAGTPARRGVSTAGSLPEGCPKHLVQICRRCGGATE